MTTRVCNRCHKELPIEEFPWYSINNPKNNQYRRKRCKPCQADYQRELLDRQRLSPIPKNTYTCAGCKTRLGKYQFARNNRNKTRVEPLCHICHDEQKVGEVIIEVDKQIRAREKPP